MSEENRKPLMIFTHTVATGGGDLTRYIQKFYFVKNMLCGTDPKGRHLNTEKKRMDARTCDLIQRYKTNLESGKTADFIYGHTPFIVNAENIFNRKIHDITMLRDPVKRFISSYRTDINNNNSLTDFKAWVKWIESGNHTLGFNWIKFNHQTDMLSGFQNDLTTEIDLQQAKENLKKFKFVGLTEEFDNSVEIFTKVFSLPYMHRKPLIKYKAKNVIPIDPDIIEFIKEKSHFDIELYEYGRKLFGEKKKQHRDTALISPTNFDRYLNYPIKDVDYWVGKVNVKIRNKLFNDIVEL